MPVLGGSAVTPASSGIKHSFTPEQFGATGNDPAHDDAPGIEAAIFAAYAACVADQSYVCEVVFDSTKNYYANRAPIANQTINGVESYAHAQIALPYRPWNWAAPNADEIVTLTLRTQVSEQAANTTFNLQPCSIITTYDTAPGFGPGIPSVLGGPAFKGPDIPTQWSGLHLVVDGIKIVSSPNPRLCGVDLTKVNTCTIWSLHVTVPTNGYTSPTPCTNIRAYGVRLPANQNGGKIRVGTMSVYGYYTGMAMPEHLIADNIMLYWNRLAISYDQPGDHESVIQQLQTSGNANLIGFLDHGIGILDVPSSLPGVVPLVVNLWGMEDITSPILDANNILNIRATIFAVWMGIGDRIAVPPMNGGANVRLTSLIQARGPVATAPTIPATTVAYKNAYGHDAWVVVTGGTVTDIAINGTATGLTSGQVLVPNGGTIAITYSAAPTWKWWLF